MPASNPPHPGPYILEECIRPLELTMNGLSMDYLLKNWLADFTYRTGIGLSIFLLSGGLLIVVAFLSVSFQALKAAGADPVHSLRYE